MFAWLGNVLIGVTPLTAPKALTERYANSYARHDVIRGKPVLQYIGEELDTREFGFFFDETFCNPDAQWATLFSAYKTKTSMPLVAGASFDGRQYIVDKLERDILKTTRAGWRTVRLEATMSLVEAPVPDLLSAALSAASGMAAGLGSSTTKPDAQR